MAQMAAGPDSMDVEDWMPSKIYLSVPLMWEILQFSFASDGNSSSSSSSNNPTAGLLDPSLTPPAPAARHNDDDDESSTLEIIVATSPEITINTADGGQEAPTMSSYKGGPTPPTAPPGGGGHPAAVRAPGPRPDPGPAWSGNDRHGGEQTTDFLSFNFTPWLYADAAQFVSMEDMGYDGSQSQSTMGGGGGESRGGMAWWEGENFSNIMFNHF